MVLWLLMDTEIRFEKLHPHQLVNILATTSTVFIPLGVLEWHEKYLPFGVDAFVAYEICLRACKQIGGCVLPPTYFGTDTIYEHNGKKYRGMNVQAGKILPGSVYPLNKTLFYSLVKTIILNLKQQGFKRIVLVSGHCEPMQMQVLNKIFNEKHVDYKVELFPRDGLSFAGGLDHAGKIETELMLAIDESLVLTNKIEKPYIVLLGDDPIEANKENGIKRLDAIVDQLVSVLLGQ